MVLEFTCITDKYKHVCLLFIYSCGHGGLMSSQEQATVEMTVVCSGVLCDTDSATWETLLGTRDPNAGQTTKTFRPTQSIIVDLPVLMLLC